MIYISPNKYLVSIDYVPDEVYDYSKIYTRKMRTEWGKEEVSNLIVNCDKKLGKKLYNILEDIVDPKIEGKNIRKSQQLTLHGKLVKVGDRIIEFKDWVSHEREEELRRGEIKKIKIRDDGLKFSVLFDAKDGKNPYIGVAYSRQSELEEGWVPIEIQRRQRQEQKEKDWKYKQSSDTRTWDSYRYKSK